MRNPVILDVNPDPDDLAWEQDFLKRLDIPVHSCRGPKDPGGCPILRNERCMKIEGVDGVLFQLNLDRGDHREILGKYLQILDVPIRVVVTPEQKERWAGLVGMVETFEAPVGPAKMDAFAAEVAAEMDD